MRILFCLLAAAAALAPVHARADDVYKWVDQNGRIHYSDSLPKDARVISVQDRLSIYSPDPAVAQALSTPAGSASSVLADRIAALERQIQSERIAQQQARDPRLP